MRRLSRALTFAVCAVTMAALPSAQVRDPLFVGVRYQPTKPPEARRQDYERMRQLRFTVVEMPRTAETAARLLFLDRVLANAPDPRVLLAARDTSAVVPVASAATTSLRAWRAFATGARVILFDDWAALQADPGALAGAADFAEAFARNTPLYAPLRPRVSKVPDVHVTRGEGAVEARFLESPEALVLIAVNASSKPVESSLAFAPEIPEAIWQNMLTGASVNFVAGADGPVYTRTFGPEEVLVLMIQRRWRLP
jgi:hypothetical protein